MSVTTEPSQRSGRRTDAAETDLDRVLREAALEQGFVRVGVARAQSLETESEAAHLRAWLADGRHGSMEWMARTESVRIDPTREEMLAAAMSVVVLVAPYGRDKSLGQLGHGRIAKYALGRDYHNVLTKRARKVARVLTHSGHRVRVAVDSKPVLERAWAQRSGVGFIGKNCCLIVPGLGSHVFLACIVTSAALPANSPMAPKCGSCTLCLDACPTDAFKARNQLDARRCISYLTIEHKAAVAPTLRSAIGSWVFGCDVCQDVCPYNRTQASPNLPESAFAPGDRWEGKSLEWFLSTDEATFLQTFEGSPLRRSGVERMARNAAIALGNIGTRQHLAALIEARDHHVSPLVCEAAGWAYDRIVARSEN